MALCRRVLNGWIPVSRQTVLVSRRWAAKNGPRQLFHLRQCRMTFYSTLVSSDEVTVEYKHGFPIISITLPSRKERCQFLVKPLLMNVGDLLKDLKNEDRGINSAGIFSEDHVSSEHSVEMDDVKNLVHRLYIALHTEDHQLHKEGELLEKLENLKGELQDLEQVKSQLFLKAEAKSSRLMWIGLALMSTQAGALAWLTWWVYSWDIMEPVTYFITYASSMAFYAYFLLTRQDCVYPDVKDRQFLHYFHRGAKRNSFDIEKYNKIKEELAEVEKNLRRLRNPLQLQLPIEQVNGKD
ncbi:calcium uniporter regulatory subunit MCUb, mitochondrial-like isoform X3 [Carcharodon carcharias]|uniref:calcium uniporter regulatory subunit MCUb, mitochondrial-like isoform X3 n=1 Tax=Carcharodon carcharias TaxID=13397 RepID=UPI001B7DB9C3|nr:calcium uniporter regulatory subunit MCUb, mitochondrial-like isoform X3 [Carcharodon carcharias]